MEQQTQSEGQRPMKQFAQNVAVNVLANLIAAAIIYLLGVGFKLLPAKPGLIILAVMILGLVGGFSLTAVSWVVLKRGSMRRSVKTFSIGSILSGLGLLLPSGYFYFIQGQDTPALLAGYGGFFLLLGIVFLIHSSSIKDDTEKSSGP